MDGSPVRGRLEASDRAGAIFQLQTQGHLLLSLSSAEVASRHGIHALLTRDLSRNRERLSARGLSELVGRLALLLEAGVPVEFALGILAGKETADVATRRHVTDLLRRLRAGASLADAMAAADRRSFPAGVIAMVRAGQASGTIAPTLTRLGVHLTQAEAVRQSVRSALVYPAVLMATAAGSILLVLLVVLPELEPIIADSGATPPLPARIAFAASGLLRQDWWMGLIALISFVFIARRALADPALQTWRDALLLRVPVLGSALRRAETGRFARALGSLVGGGVALPTALALAQPVLVNRVIADAVARVAAGVREGGGLSGPLAAARVMPDLAVQLIRIGEATGRLSVMLTQLAELCEADVRRTLDRALALLVPLITIILGGVVAGIIASVMTALLSVNDMIGR